MPSFNLSADKWKTVGGHFGAKVVALSIHVETDRVCRWRRIGLIPWAGKFQKDKVVFMWNVIVQVKSPVATTCFADEI